ncbi:MAG: helix-turn-helix transcriptional regulator [Planctomycetes bacterium]|nr:helix-turn-helix transcriptional regulator [Planctomycetota bacterium]
MASGSPVGGVHCAYDLDPKLALSGVARALWGGMIGPSLMRIGTSRERMVSAAGSASFPVHGIAMAGVTEASKDYAFVRERPQRSQVLACVRGSGEVLVGGRWTPCLPGTVYVTPHEVPHAYRSTGRAGWRIAWVSYARPVVRAAAPVLIASDGEPLVAAIEGLVAESRGADDAVILRSWTELLHAQVLRILRLSAGSSRLWPIWRACDDDPGRAWTLGELAAIGGVSAEHLRRLCQHELGRSPMRHLAYLRVRAACTMLALEEVDVASLAARMGYASPFAFSAAFKRIAGVPPTAYRTLLRAGKAPPL